MRGSRLQLAIVAVYGGLLALLIVSNWGLWRSSSAASSAAQNLLHCRQLEEQIQTLKAAPAQASLRVQSVQDLGLKIQRAAQLSGITGSAITRIEPQASRRVGKSAHVQQPTRVEIRQISLEQLAKFLGELISGQPGLEVTSIRLTVPRAPANAPPAEVWAAELVLTQLVFSPEYTPQLSPNSVPKAPQD